MADETDMAGVKAETVQIKPLVEKPTGADVIDVVTTAPGTMNDRGLVPVGTLMSIKKRHFSKNWMRNATKADFEAKMGRPAGPQLEAMAMDELKVMLLSLGVKTQKQMMRSQVIQLIRAKLSDVEIIDG